MKGEAQLGRYYALVLFFIGAMAGVVTSNLLLMFVFWEITALCSYALISFYNDDPKAVAGGMKALIITQLGGVGLLVGALLCLCVPGNDEIHIFLDKAGSLPVDVLAADGLWLPGRCGSQIGAVALPDLAARCDGSADPDQRADPRGHDGQRRGLPAGAFLPGLRGVPCWREAVMMVGCFRRCWRP